MLFNILLFAIPFLCTAIPGYFISKKYAAYYNHTGISVILICAFIWVLAGFVVWLSQPIHMEFSRVTFWAVLSSVVSAYFVLFVFYRVPKEINYFFLSILFGFVFVAVINSVWFNHQTVIDRIDVKTLKESFLSDDDEKRLVVEKNAREMAKKVLGQTIKRYPDASLGSVFSLDSKHASLDIVNGERIWVFPIDFHKWFDQERLDNSIPAYITLSSSSVDSKAKLVSKNKKGEDISIKWSNGMFFGQHLGRKLYDLYSEHFIYESRIRLDDDMNPHYIGYVVEATTGYKNYKSLGIIHFDLQTGDHAYYKKDEAKKALPWLEVIESPELSFSLIEDWAYYHADPFPSINAASTIGIATTSVNASDVALIESTQGNIWYTGLTSNSSGDDSITAMMGINIETGEAYFHRLGFGGGDEDAAIDAIESELGKEKDVWSPVQPIPHNLLGKYPSYIVPVISDTTGMFIGIGIVNIEHTTKKIFHKGNDMESAISKYLSVLNSSDIFVTNDSETLTLGGVIDTLNFDHIDNVPHFFITLVNNNEVIKCNASEVRLCFKLKISKNFEFDVISNGDGFNYVKAVKKLDKKVEKI